VNRADEDDFRAFVTARSASLLWFAHLLTGDRHLAEDTVQTALAKTALAWSRVRRKDNPEGYVRRAIVTTHLNAQRRRPWREQPRQFMPDDEQPPGLLRAEDERDERDAMWRALAELPPRQRAVLVLRYYEELSEAEISEVLGCSRGTVKSQASKGLLHLRRIVEKEEARS
jgi:RNA polymerase sigma-70 factor (sigma-E family)